MIIFIQTSKQETAVLAKSQVVEGQGQIIGSSIPQFGTMPDGRSICPKCHAYFQTLRSAKRHYQSVHSGIVFTCEICSKEHNRKDRLKEHLINKHAIKHETVKLLADIA